MDIQLIGSTVKSTHMGDIDLQITNKKGEEEIITLEDVLYVPETDHRLISTEALIFAKRASIDMTPHGRYLSLGGSKIPLMVENGVPALKSKVIPPNRSKCGIVATMKEKSHMSGSYLLHMRYGHCHAERIKHLDVQGSQEFISCGNCLVCLLSKPQKKNFPKEAYKSGERTMQIDIASYPPSYDGYRHIMVIGIKDTACLWTYTLRKKNEAKESMKHWLNIHLKLIPDITRPTCLQTDNARELDFTDIAADHGLKYRKTGTYSPQQNGCFIERALAEVEKMALALLIQANLPKEYWPHAVRHAVTIINRLPNPKLDWLTALETTYIERGYAKVDLKVFGCLAAVQVPAIMHKKLEYERQIGIYVGNSTNSPDLIILLPNGRTVSSQHVFIHEHLRGIDKASIFSAPDGSCLPQIKDMPISLEPVGGADYWPTQNANIPFSCTLDRDYCPKSPIHCNGKLNHLKNL